MAGKKSLGKALFPWFYTCMLGEDQGECCTSMTTISHSFIQGFKTKISLSLSLPFALTFFSAKKQPFWSVFQVFFKCSKSLFKCWSSVKSLATKGCLLEAWGILSWGLLPWGLPFKFIIIFITSSCSLKGSNLKNILWLCFDSMHVHIWILLGFSLHNMFYDQNSFVSTI